jgi:NMT1-like family
MRFPSLVPKGSWRDLATAVGPVLLIFLIVAVVMLRFINPAPPTRLTISAGPDGSTFRRHADKYQKILARNGITLTIIASEGSLENLQRLVNPNVDVDIGLVQGGLSGTVVSPELVSLGNLFYEPLYVFYRSNVPLRQLSELKGRRIAIGPERSGTHAFALALLKANGIEPNQGAFLADLGGQDASAALRERRIDAAFMMNDSSAPSDVRGLLHDPDVRVFSFEQADAYIRHFRFLARLDLSPGSFDLGDNIPAQALTLLAPTVELLARPGLHPALSDLLIETAREAHGHAGLLHAAGEFPNALEHEYPISQDAARYYKSGKSFSYRHLPFWLASLVDRIVVVLVPTLILLIPSLKMLPAVYSWRVRRRIHHRYADLMALERDTLQATTPEQRAPLLARLEQIENAVIKIKIPAAFADQVYVLREHIEFVRDRLSPASSAAQ